MCDFHRDPNHPKFGCPAQSDDDLEEMKKIYNVRERPAVLYDIYEITSERNSH